MMILPDRSAPRARFLLPVPASQWREPSQAVPRDQLGNPTTQIRFRIRARAHDGGIAWQGWFDDREDCDAFLEAIALGTLKYQRPLWDLPSPGWHPWLDGGLFYEFATVTFLSTTGSNQTYTKPADWNNADNIIECLGGGASGYTNLGNGGAGGGYTKLTNITLAGNATYRVGAGGLADGNDGGDTWFNDTVYPTTGTDKVGAKGGLTKTDTYGNASGGASTSGYPAGGTRYSGGDGGAGNSSGFGGAGGGGAAGKNGNGNTGATAPANDNGSAGGSGDAGFGGAAGSAGVGGAGGNGGNGTEWDATHGSGGGGGGGTGNTPDYAGGSGGNYGAGSGSGGYVSGSSPAGKQGLIVVTYTPAAVTTSLVFDRYASFRHILVR